METTHQPSKLKTVIITYLALYLCSTIFYVLVAKDVWRVIISVIGIGVGIWIGRQLRDGRYVFLSKKTVNLFLILFVMLTLLLMVGCIAFGEFINASTVITSSGPLFASTLSFYWRSNSNQSPSVVHQSSEQE